MEKFNLQKYIVGKYVKKETIIWPREIKIAKKLTNAYPQQDFWESFELTFMLNSLAWLLSARGAETVVREYNLFNHKVQEREKIGLSKEKIGDDGVVEKKADGVLAFLDN